MNLDAACLGNHDLDLGLVEFSILKDQCTFPWICSNVWQKDPNIPLGGCHEYIVLESKNEAGPKAKFLVLGMVEEEWIDTLSTIEPKDISYEGFVEYIKRRVPEVCTSTVEGSLVVVATTVDANTANKRPLPMYLYLYISLSRNTKWMV